MATEGEQSSGSLAGEEGVEISLSEDDEDALMMMCLTLLAQVRRGSRSSYLRMMRMLS